MPLGLTVEGEIECSVVCVYNPSLMYSHAPVHYTCPICLGIQGIESDQTLLKQSDLTYRDSWVSVFINSFWVGRNEGHAIVVPNDHVEHIYDLPDEIGGLIISLARRVAIAMREVYRCDGVTLRQNNEPAGGQHAYHFHLHVIPRYSDDDFDKEVVKGHRLATPDERVSYSQKLRSYLENSV